MKLAKIKLILKKNMTMKALSLIFFLSLVGYSFGQDYQIIDYSQIENHMAQYDSLLVHYKDGKSLPLSDYRLLYYGYTFQEAYKPYEKNPLEQEISDLMAAGLDEENTQLLIKKSQDYLDLEPFSLKYNYYLRNFLNNSKEDVQRLDQDLQIQYKGVVNAILSSGDGLSQETAYRVNHPSDEYMVMRYLKWEPLNSSFESTYDIFEVKDSEGKKQTIYFDVSRMAQVGLEQMGIETVTAENDEIPEDAVEIGSMDELMTFVPTGMKTLAEVEGDFDQDGDQDWLLVVKKNGEEVISDASSGAKEPRLLLLIKRNDKGLLELAYTNANAVPCVDCGGGPKDPFVYITFVNDALVMKTQGGDLFQWERLTTFNFDDVDFKMVKDEYKSFRKGKEDQATTDVETPEQFGTITLEQFQFDN